MSAVQDVSQLKSDVNFSVIMPFSYTCQLKKSCSDALLTEPLSALVVRIFGYTESHVKS